MMPPREHFHAAPPTSVVVLDIVLQLWTSFKGSRFRLRLAAILTGSCLSLQLGSLGILDRGQLRLKHTRAVKLTL